MSGEVSRTFRSMNTDVLVIVGSGDWTPAAAESAIDRIESLFAEVESGLSRFRADSELSALNRAAGEPFVASPLLFEVVARSLDAARDSRGVFDPTVLGSLAAAGYDRSFELLRDVSDGSGGGGPPARACSWRDVRLDRRTRAILQPPGCGLDLGGIAKGWTVDRAVRLLLPDFASFAVDAGGDLFARGAQGDGSPWTVGVEDPRDPARDLAVLTVRDRAVATSSVARRRWVRDGRARHHLIDPRTGEPAAGDVLAATVVAASVARAEVLAKVALVLGAAAGRRFLDARPDAGGILALADGGIATSDGLREAWHVA
jgi:thiamine biosynthesis lipoprotein